jgi:general stress protein 26
MDSKHDQVRITGKAEVLEDEAEIQAIWEANPLLRQYLGTPENPMLIIYKIIPQQVRFMREWALEYHEVPVE